MSSQPGSQQMEPQIKGPPYPSANAGFGGLPTKSVDIPVSAVLIFLFILGAVWHMTTLQINLRRGHKFVISGACFGLCMARISANTMRIVWACYPTNVGIGIATNVLANAGVVILFIVNLIFTQRFLRAYHPKFGWSTPGKVIFRALYVLVGLSIVMLIIAIVYSFFTLDVVKKDQLHKVSLVGSTFLDVLAFLPIPAIALIVALPGRAQPIDKFGQGRMRTKMMMVLFTAVLLTFGATMRAVASYIVRPREDPGWYQHKAVLFCANYVVELTCIYTYGLMRIDKRFHVPDGSNRYGHYRNGVPEDEQKKNKKGPANKDGNSISGSEKSPDDGNADPSELEKANNNGQPSSSDWDARAREEAENIAD